MKKILLLLVMMLMVANAAFAMVGVVEQQTIKGVNCGMSWDEALSKWGQPTKIEKSMIASGTYVYYPGGLYAYVKPNKEKVMYMDEITVENNPQIVLLPSGVANGMCREEVFNRLGKPEKETSSYDDKGLCVRWYYTMPRYKDFAGRSITQELSILFCVDDRKPNYDQVISISMEGY